MKTISFEGPKVKMRILAFFLDNPTKELYESEARKKAEVSIGSANKYLKELAHEGALLLSKRGTMNFYRLNRENTVVKKLKVARTLSLPALSALGDLGKRLGVKTYLFGSSARGEDAEGSDIDILIIGNVKPDSLEAQMRPIRSNSERQIRISLFTSQEWVKMRGKDPAFFERVEKDKVDLA